ncbi:MAG: hypothetical protein CM15mP81_14390 [Alphaproteobacteria bacterium]|jgi:amino acid transporter|nr:MAG: hypothetical protein CM15mP81_14390 [Alphaproteobacteria bacterium]|tara:strand:+ start:144 stop:329 length:186 start_codon:yes stop_codon:yes gene_type:complete
MRIFDPKKLVFYTFIIGSLYFIQLSSHNDELSAYTPIFWIVFMFACLGLYWFRTKKEDKDN